MQAVDRLTAAGYREGFRAEEDGLRAVATGCVHRPEALAIDELVRFEGQSDSEEQAILFALRCTQHGVKGSDAVVCGPGMSALDVEMVRRLPRERAV